MTSSIDVLRASYFAGVPDDELAQLGARATAALTGHRDLAQNRQPRQALVSAALLDDGLRGLSVDVVADDMPFLVDSLTAELSRWGCAISWLVHPQLAVRRDAAGVLVEVAGSAGESCPAGFVAESWIHVEAVTARSLEVDDLVGSVRGVLGDVRVAVEDWEAMRRATERLAGELASEAPWGLSHDEVDQAVELLEWFAGGAFTFLGYGEYALEEGADSDQLVPVEGTALGLLRPHEPSSRRRSFTGATLSSPTIRSKAREPHLLVLTKANSRSTVHRPAYLDYVGIKKFDADGKVVGERRLVGLLSTTAYSDSVRHIPVVRQKVEAILAKAGTTTQSHSGRGLLQVLEAYPRDELFSVDVDTLAATVRAVLRLQERRRVRLFVRRDDYGRFASCLVYLPRDRYDTRARIRMEGVLRKEFGADSIEYSARVTESVLARLHFVVRVAAGQELPEVDVPLVEARLAAAVRTWGDELAEAVSASAPRVEADRLLARYSNAFPEAYKEDFDALAAVQDLRRLESLDDPVNRGFVTAVSPAVGSDTRRFTVYRSSPVSISRLLPLLARMGVEVLDERPYELERGDGTSAWVYALGVRYTAEPVGDTAESEASRLFQEAFAAVWHGEADSDGLDELVLKAAVSWRQVLVLRAAARWLRQAGTVFSTFSPAYVEQAVVRNADAARLLVQLFEAKFDPARATGRAEAVEHLLGRTTAAIDAVESLDDDRILRGLLGVVLAALRTNYFQLGTDGRPKPYLSLKLDPHSVPELPEPRPRFEIFVHSPTVEGVHLRFGAVARGGLRWSDRREDFRTEVLGLVKAQAVKNAVIVPVGAKGGFVVRSPKADPRDREAFLAEGVAAYTTFIRGLLDITDNRVQARGRSEIVEPPRVVRHDGDDPYLVVAADKGTATFSDIANAIAADYSFWLGDAFASGGSVGYDHKAMGITARGAWEAVKRRFRELGHDTQTQPFTVVGVGDMSGDVFGNGMLLSRQIRLVAAFDHRHVFLDPDPDPETSFVERQRLFTLPRSSWADYDPTLISAGGGVHSRALKHIPVTEQVRVVLGLPDGVNELPPTDLVKAILLAPVDLFWNGGIGTYVKAATESHVEVGDKANDPVRVNGGDLRARVVGEGGNLGLTQLGRVEAALHGVRLGTDAIDNSAGVDTSDHEVNIKIVVDTAVRDGVVPGEERGELLQAMTGDVGALVLRDNYLQNALLGVGRVLAGSMLPVHERLMAQLEERGALDRRLERLPGTAALRARAAEGGGLSTPEYAVLVAYVKNVLAADLLASPVPDEGWTVQVLRDYFPPLLQERLGTHLDEHPLSREIVSTQVVNDLVNRAGVTFGFRAQEETGASMPDVARAYVVVREVFALDPLWRRVEALDGQVGVAAQNALVMETRRLVDRAARWFLQSRPPGLDVEQETGRYAAPLQELAPRVVELVGAQARARLTALTERLAIDGVPRELAASVAELLDTFSLLDVVEVARSMEQEPAEVAPLYFALEERFAIEALLSRIAGLPRSDRWQAMARASVRYDLYATLASITRAVLTETEPGDPADRIPAWEQGRAELLARTRATVDAALSVEPADLATMSVALRALRTLVR